MTRAGRGFVPGFWAALATALMLGVVSAGPAHAAWPDRPIVIIVHFAPGGANDLLARLIAAELAPVLGQSMVVENRPGANGNLGLRSCFVHNRFQRRYSCRI